MLATLPVERVAMCHTPMKASESATDTIAARKRREKLMRRLHPPVEGEGRTSLARQQASASRCLPDLEARKIIVRLAGIECLAHHRERFVRSRGRREPHLGHDLPGVGGEIDLLGDRLVIDIALDL